jgi:hypothetical protein
MFKFLVFVLLVALANAGSEEWREGTLDARCPEENGLVSFYINGETCDTFYECSFGKICK